MLGGQASKATPTGAIAKFAASGKVQAKKNLGLMQMQCKNVYVAYVSMGTNPACTEESRLLWRLSEGTFGEAEPEGRTSGCATVRAFNEAENYNGPAIIIAYARDPLRSLRYRLCARPLRGLRGFPPMQRFAPYLRRISSSS